MCVCMHGVGMVYTICTAKWSSTLCLNTTPKHIPTSPTRSPFFTSQLMSLSTCCPLNVMDMFSSRTPLLMPLLLPGPAACNSVSASAVAAAAVVIRSHTKRLCGWGGGVYPQRRSRGTRGGMAPKTPCLFCVDMRAVMGCASARSVTSRRCGGVHRVCGASLRRQQTGCVVAAMVGIVVLLCNIIV